MSVVAVDPPRLEAAVVPADVSLEQWRVALGLIGSIQTRVLTCALFGTRAARAASGADGQLGQTLKENVAGIEKACQDIARVVTFVEGHGTDGNIPKTAAKWIREFAYQHSDIVRLIRNAANASKEIGKIAKGMLDGDVSGATEMDRVLQDHSAATKALDTSLSEFVVGAWKEINTAKLDEIDRSAKANIEILDTLKKLERIGKHVRLVSLNASVEASRAGDAGKGLAVIAVEFKSLAEEIQNLSANARDNFDNHT
ncbi:MAG: methyl-accepting chemotaxis protein [Paracoccaceae bacterium]